MNMSCFYSELVQTIFRFKPKQPMAKSNFISMSRDYGITSESRCQSISVDISICLHLSEWQICIFWVLTIVVCTLRVSTAKKHWEVNFWSLKLHLPLVIGRWQDCPNHLTNRFHVAVRLFNNWSQMTSKCGKNKNVAHDPMSVCVAEILTSSVIY